MKLFRYIEKYFWAFLVVGIILGLCCPGYNDSLMLLLKPLLIAMLFMVYLKMDIAQVVKRMTNYRQMAFLASMYMVIIPLIFFLAIRVLNPQYAIAILLLIAMPAAVSSPALTDIVKGNVELSAAIVIITSVIAPFSVPLLFWILHIDLININSWMLFKDLAFIVFFPLISAQIVKKYFSRGVKKSGYLFSGINVMILALMTYIVMGSQRDVILNDPLSILGKIGLLYIVFILLHMFGYFLGYKENRKGKIATTIGAAYMNNGMAIVIAATYMEPSILVIMVLSDLPWNTLLVLFQRVIKQSENRSMLAL